MATDEISARDYNRNPRNFKEKSRWPFKGIDDPEYIKERDEFFKENGAWYVMNKSSDTRGAGNNVKRVIKSKGRGG